MDANVHCRNSGNPLSADASAGRGLTPAGPALPWSTRVPARCTQIPPYRQRPP